MRNLSNFQLFRARKDQKILLKIVLMLLFYHCLFKRYQKSQGSQAVSILRVWPARGFLSPSNHCARLGLPIFCCSLLPGSTVYESFALVCATLLHDLPQTL